jgi:hypothetical protein
MLSDIALYQMPLKLPPIAMRSGWEAIERA